MVIDLDLIFVVEYSRLFQKSSRMNLLDYNEETV